MQWKAWPSKRQKGRYLIYAARSNVSMILTFIWAELDEFTDCSCAEIISQMASERAMKAAVSYYDAGIEKLVCAPYFASQVYIAWKCNLGIYPNLAIIFNHLKKYFEP